MRLSQYIERKPERRSVSRRKSDRHTSVMTHGIFVPMVTVWGAALFGLSVLVLPSIAIDRMAMVTGLGLGLDGIITRFAFAGIAALMGAALAFIIAGAVRSAAIHRADDDSLMTAVHSRRNQPIDPSSELGSDSLDAPIETMPFADDRADSVSSQPIREAPSPDPASRETSEETEEYESKPTLGELAMRGYELDPADAPAPMQGRQSPKKEKPAKDDLVFTHKQFQSALIESCEGATCEAVAETRDAGNRNSEPQAACAPASASRSDLPDRPEQLDLGEFAQLPGRNGVWVESQEDPSAAPPLMSGAPRPQVPNAGALEKLRQTPPEQLSLVEMVERFAAALHERQRADREREPSGRGAHTDAALAEALRALTVFTSGSGDGTDEPGGQGPQTQREDAQVAATERELRAALAKLQDLRGAA